jgi:hypothetical protein
MFMKRGHVAVTICFLSIGPMFYTGGFQKKTLTDILKYECSASGLLWSSFSVN